MRSINLLLLLLVLLRAYVQALPHALLPIRRWLHDTESAKHTFMQTPLGAVNPLAQVDTPLMWL